MTTTELILGRLLNVAGESHEYFVTGSLSFLPLLDNYREPEHDVDAAIAEHLFAERKEVLQHDGTIHRLRLSEVAVAQDSKLTRLFSPKTGFIHASGSGGLLDLACYRRAHGRFIFSLGGKLTLEVPDTIVRRLRYLEWQGVTFQAGPPELAFIPKAAGYLRSKTLADTEHHFNTKHLNDLRRLMKIVDWDFVKELTDAGGIYFLGRRPPTFIRWP